MSPALLAEKVTAHRAKVTRWNEVLRDYPDGGKVWKAEGCGVAWFKGLRETWAVVLVASLAVLVGASAGSSGAASAGRAIGASGAVQSRTLLAIRYPIKAFAQGGGRIAWISSRSRGRGRSGGCALRVRTLSSGRTAVTRLRHPSCERNYLWWSGALALAGRSAAWVEDAFCGNVSCSWKVVRAVAGDRRARVVGRADFSCPTSCDSEDPRPLLAGSGRLLAYSYVTLGQVKRIVAGGTRPLFATTGVVQGLAVGGGRVGAVSLTLGGGPGRLDAPAWSPDGTKLAVAHGAFVVSDTAAFPVAVMNADGTGLRDLPSSDTCLFVDDSGGGFAWSPDGQRIAYTDCWPHIRGANVDGSGDQLLTDGAGPAWSPDGTTIAFERDSLENATPAIYVMNPDGSNIRELASLGTDLQHHMGPLAWSPNGTHIAFSLDGSLEVVNADGSDPHQLGAAKGDEPTWSPDSSQIAFRGAHGLFVISANGTDLRRLTTGPDAHPSWSPNGKTIVFARQAFTTIDGQQLKDLYAVDPDGSNLRPFAVPPVKLESTTKVRSSKVRTTFTADGTPAGLALEGKLAAVGSVTAGIDRITLFKATTGARLSSIKLGADHGDFSVVGADAHWIVFHVGQKISALNIHSRKVLALARAAPSRSGCARLSACLSVSGRRVAWAENINGHGRIRALQLPS